MASSVGEAVYVEGGPENGQNGAGQPVATHVGMTETPDVTPNGWEKFLYGESACCCPCGVPGIGPCLPCWLFFGVGWIFTILFFFKVASTGSDIFSFEEPAVKTDPWVQQWFAKQAAVRSKEMPGCMDTKHQAQDVCENDDKCEWDTKRGGSCGDIKCPSPPPKPRQVPLYLDFMPAWVFMVYEAKDGANILDDDILAAISKYESELGTGVGGAKSGGTRRSPGTPSAWDEEWCMLSYPSDGFNTDPKCSPGVSPMYAFSMTDAAMTKVKDQTRSGFHWMPLMSCLCSTEDTLCSICNADGSMKGGNASLMDTMSYWPSEVTSCIAQEIARMGSITTTTSTTTTAANSSYCVAKPTGGWGGMSMSSMSEMAIYGMLRGMLTEYCKAKPSCQWSPPNTHPYCASTGFYFPSDSEGLLTGDKKEAILDKMCDPNNTLWYNYRSQVLPRSFDCTASKYHSKYARSFFMAGAPSEDFDSTEFTKGYVEAYEGWYQSARKLEAQAEKETNGKLRIMFYSGATVIAQYLEILSVDGFLSLGSLVLVWVYMWFTVESVFLASCGMFEIVFSLPVGMSLWTIILQQKIFWYQMLVIYMILGIGADDVFILYDAWLQSAYEGPAISGDKKTRFAWAYRRSFHAMLVTTATTCGSFVIGATSPLPQVQSFCVFAAVVVFVDWVFCVTFFASAVMVYDRFFAVTHQSCCDCRAGFGCGKLQTYGRCFGPGCCCGGFRALFSCCGTCWSCMSSPPVEGQPPQPRALEKFFAGPVFRFYKRFAIPLVLFWVLVVIALGTYAGMTLRTAKKRSPLGRDNIDVIKGFEIMLDEFQLRGTPSVTMVYGLDDDSPIKEWGSSHDTDKHNYGGSSAKNVKTPANQLELLDLCRAPDKGKDEDKLRCDWGQGCLTKGSPVAMSCEADTNAWRTNGFYMPADVLCSSGRYCIMEDITYFWAYKRGNCMAETTPVACNLNPGCAFETINGMGYCYSTTNPSDYPGLPEDEFITLLSKQMPSSSKTEFEDYMERKLKYLEDNGRNYESDFIKQFTGLRLNDERTDVQFLWVSFNATFPRENTVDQANDWYNRWENFRVKYAGDLGGYQTAELYLYLVTQNEMVKAATMGIGLSLLVSYLVLVLTTMNWWTGTLGLVTIICITASFLGLVPIMGWSLGENECIFMIATVGLSVDYTVHLLNAYNSVAKPTRAERVQGALMEMGISVANSAITTLLAALILFGCGFFFFFQFGGFIFMVIGLSILLSTNLLMPLMVLIGPQHDQGKFMCLRRAPAKPSTKISSE